MPTRLDLQQQAQMPAFENWLATRQSSGASVDQIVSKIIAKVRADGDQALCAYTAQFDRLNCPPAKLRLPADKLAKAHQECAPEVIAALKLAARRIQSFHAKLCPQDIDYTDELDLRLGLRWGPLDSVGLYVPGGTAAYPSSVLMNAIPAAVAGVERLVMVVPSPDGFVNPLVLAAAHIAGVKEVYTIGGAQAIAALAYGTETIAPVDKIVGPGNAYVAAAKRQVFGDVGIDMIAGPSEILVIADGDNNPDWVAIDLLSQAEHDIHAQAVLITPDADFAKDVMRAVDRQLTTLPRQHIAGQSWQDNGAVLLVKDFDHAADISNRLAPEHLQLAVETPHRLMDKIRHAGSIFLGRYTPEAVGDYLAGPNHVLPTARSARFSSGLSVLDFLKRSSFMQCDGDNLHKIGPQIMALAEAEGLHAHARSVAVRLNLPKGD